MNDGIVFTLAFLVAFGFPTGAISQHKGERVSAVSLPSNRTEAIPSPDGAWALVAGPSSQRTIILENRSEHKRKLVKKYERSAQVGWSPDSRAFFLNDAYGSNLEDAFITGSTPTIPCCLTA